MVDKKTHADLKKSDVEDALARIEECWSDLNRPGNQKNTTLIPLPHSYIVPSTHKSDHFAFNEQYYWDTYFIILGLENEKLATGMLSNLLFLLEEFGLVPNANRYYFTSRSQPPMLTTLLFHIYDKYNKSDAWLQKHIKIAKKEYSKVWTSSEHPYDHCVHVGLSRYYDINYLHDLAEAESGWDMTPRFERKCLDFLPIDLNCLLYKYEQDFARAASIAKKDGEMRVWQHAAKERRKTVNKLMWNKRKGMFFDYNFHEGRQGSVWSLAAYYALWSGLATDEQAVKLVKNLDKFEQKGGLTTTTSTPLSSRLFGSKKTQWAYPNGWAPLHLYAVEGLEKYGYSDRAKTIAKKWLKTNNDWYHFHGTFQEKYNVVNPELEPMAGVYPSQVGFGWTNAIFKYLAEKYL